MDEAAPESLVDTILFVDVDGVLNVGIWSLIGKPLSYFSFTKIDWIPGHV